MIKDPPLRCHSPSLERMLSREQRARVLTPEGPKASNDLTYTVNYSIVDKVAPTVSLLGHGKVESGRNMANKSGAPLIFYNRDRPKLHTKGAVKFDRMSVYNKADPLYPFRRPKTSLPRMTFEGCSSLLDGVVCPRGDRHVRSQRVDAVATREQRQKTGYTVEAPSKRPTANVAGLRVSYSVVDPKSDQFAPFGKGPKDRMGTLSDNQRLQSDRAATPGNSEVSSNVFDALRKTKRNICRGVPFGLTTGRQSFPVGRGAASSYNEAQRKAWFGGELMHGNELALVRDADAKKGPRQASTSPGSKKGKSP